MRIGIDCRTILSPETGELAGTAHYTYELVRHLLILDKNNTYVLFFDARIKNVRNVVSNKNAEIVFLPVSRVPLLTTHFYLARALTRAKLDLFHSPAHPLPLFYSGRMVWTVHDLAIYDHSEWFPGGLRQWFSTRFTVPRSIQRAERLIAPSESTKRDILRIFNVPEEKIKIIYEGVPSVIASPAKQSHVKGIASSSDLGRSPRNDNKSPYFLFIGTVEPRKNLVRLIDAFIRFRKDNLQLTTYNLQLAGGNGWKNDDIFMAIERANLKLGKGSVQYCGYVSEEEKIALLQNATAFAWPSLYEGFGLPVLEAMAAGVPVITSNTSSIPEVAGDAALCVSPKSVPAIAEAMERIAGDAALREQLKKRGLIRGKRQPAKRFPFIVRRMRKMID